MVRRVVPKFQRKNGHPPDGRLRPSAAAPRRRDRSLADVEPESCPAVSPSCCGLSTAPLRWFSPTLSAPFPCCWKTGRGWLSLFPCGPRCDTECKSSRLRNDRLLNLNFRPDLCPVFLQ